MRLAFALLAALTLTAEERYVPIAIGTELLLTNPATHRTTVTIEHLGGETSRLDIEAGETIRWTAPTSDGVLRIEGDAHVTATSTRNGARISLPVATPRDATEEANLQPRAPWRSGVLAINASDATTFVTVDDTLHTIAPRGTLRVDNASTVRARTPLLLFAYDANDTNGVRVFTPISPIAHAQTRKRRAVRSGAPAPVTTQTVTLTPSKDNTLFQTLNGTISNGAGVHVFIGRIRTSSRRRALLAFDVASQIPPGSHITKASLAMTVSRSASGAEPATLHRVTKDWGEGTSDAGSAADGTGAPATTGDATWLHTFSPDARWTTEGGDFESPADATASVAGSGAAGTWASAAMIARVQQWLDQPSANFGWIVIGNETRNSSAKRLDSREESPAATRPTLTIEFQR